MNCGIFAGFEGIGIFVGFECLGLCSLLHMEDFGPTIFL